MYINNVRRKQISRQHVWPDPPCKALIRLEQGHTCMKSYERCKFPPIDNGHRFVKATSHKPSLWPHRLYIVGRALCPFLLTLLPPPFSNPLLYLPFPSSAPIPSRLMAAVEVCLIYISVCSFSNVSLLAATAVHNTEQLF